MIAGVVLAGGQSSRMGRDKSLMQLQGSALIEHAKNLLINAGIKNTYISGKDGIQDQFINKGPLSGISASLENLKEYSQVLFTTVDMPLLDIKVINEIIKHQKSPAVYIKNYCFPLLILNTNENRHIINLQILSEDLSIKKMLHNLNAVELENKFSKEVFSNVNTNEDWLKVLKILC